MQDDSPNPTPTPPDDRDAMEPAARRDDAIGPAPDDGDLDEFGDSPWPALPAPEPAIPPEAVERSRRALIAWLAILVVFGAGGVVFGQQELALLVAVAGVVIAAHAADFHPRFELLYRIVSVALIGTCGASLLGLASALRTYGVTGPLATLIPAIAGVSGLVMFATGIPQVARWLAHTLFGARGDSHSYRLAARLTLFGFLLAVPLWFAAKHLFEQEQDMSEMFQSLSLGGAVFGYVILALASVGFLVRRDLRSTLERLGLTRPRPRDLLLVAIGVPVLFAINTAGEWGQQHWFHSLWQADQRINESMAGALDRRAMILLSLTAGIGEEITMRGALQPKLGLVRTSLFFAALHVQYSWYGMGLIFMLGIALGLIRKRSNTAVAMTVHALYDLFALIAT